MQFQTECCRQTAAMPPHQRDPVAGAKLQHENRARTVLRFSRHKFSSGEFIPADDGTN
jgi:hypothetical protein